MYIYNFSCYMDDLNNYKQKLLTLKKETNNELAINSINNTIDNVNNLSDELNKKND